MKLSTRKRKMLNQNKYTVLVNGAFIVATRLYGSPVQLIIGLLLFFTAHALIQKKYVY